MLISVFFSSQNILIPHDGVAAFPDNHFIVGLHDTVLPYSGHEPKTSETTPLLVNRDAKQSGHDLHNRLIRRLGSFGREPHQFIQVTGITTSSFTDDIIVCDSILNRISVFSSSGQLRTCFYCNCSIRDVAMTRGGTILVTVSKSNSHLLREYSVDGRFIAGYGSFYQHENPFGVTVTSKDQPVVTGLRQNTVHVLTQRRKPSVRFGSRGRGATHFTVPYYVTTNPDDEIIVSDTGNHRIKVHKLDGSFVRMFGSQGTKPGELFYPMGICTDMYGNIYVADANNFRVQAFTFDGCNLGFPVKDTYEYGMDVKPISVQFLGDKTLLVVLRGSSFCQVHSYFWDVNRFPARKATKAWYKELLCCVTLYH